MDFKALLCASRTCLRPRFWPSYWSPVSPLEVFQQSLSPKTHSRRLLGENRYCSMRLWEILVSLVLGPCLESLLLDRRQLWPSVAATGLRRPGHDRYSGDPYGHHHDDADEDEIEDDEYEEHYEEEEEEGYSHPGDRRGERGVHEDEYDEFGDLIDPDDYIDEDEELDEFEEELGGPVSADWEQGNRCPQCPEREPCGGGCGHGAMAVPPSITVGGQTTTVGSPLGSPQSAAGHTGVTVSGPGPERGGSLVPPAGGVAVSPAAQALAESDQDAQMEQFAEEQMARRRDALKHAKDDGESEEEERERTNLEAGGSGADVVRADLDKGLQDLAKDDEELDDEDADLRLELEQKRKGDQMEEDMDAAKALSDAELADDAQVPDNIENLRQADGNQALDQADQAAGPKPQIIPTEKDTEAYCEQALDAESKAKKDLSELKNNRLNMKLRRAQNALDAEVEKERKLLDEDEWEDDRD